MSNQDVRSTEKTPEEVELEKKEQEEQHKSHLTYDDEVIKKIAALATTDVKGILGMSGNLFQGLQKTLTGNENLTAGIQADIGEKQVAIDVSVYVEYGLSVPEIYRTAYQNVKANISQMTGLDVVEFNMHVDDVYTREEFVESNKSKAKTNSSNSRVE